LPALQAVQHGANYDIKEIAAGYSTDDEQAAFGAGWSDGAAQSPGMMRKAIEGDDDQPELS
jgi:hypothetical protein